jgi:hypothetical protein
MITAIQQLASELPLQDHYNWEMPATLPITIPPDVHGAFERNLYLKRHLKESFNDDSNLQTSLWIIQHWGGIKTFKDTEQNRQRIETFYTQLQNRQLTKDTHSVLPSLSKLAAFRWPERYSIYDSRAVFALNWLLFCHTSEPKLFPQPPGRSKALVEVDTHTLFRLSGKPYSVRSHKVAYFEYCDLLSELSSEALGKEGEPYYAEMLLFVAAPEWIPRDIRNRTTVTIKTNGEQDGGGQPATRSESKFSHDYNP